MSALHEQFERREADELTHWDMNQAIHETHKEDQHLYSLFAQSRSFLVGMIQWDEESFRKWAVDHPPPGIQLAPRRARSFSNQKEA